MIPGVKFDDKHCFDDYGMILASKNIGFPETQTTFIDIPGRDGPLDLTEALSGDVHYNARTIELTFITSTPISKQDWPAFLQNIGNDLHGKRKQIIFDDDPEYYYDGRCEINEFETFNGRQTVVIECTCEPYKYNISDPNAKSL